MSSGERRRLREDAILSSLIYDRMTDRERAVSDVCEHTFDWAFEEQIREECSYEGASQPNPLPQWLSKEKGLFLITGKAGSGKSTFMRYLASHNTARKRLEGWARANSSSLLIASHFFWSSGGKMQSTQEGLWQNILFLILKQHRELISLMFSQRLGDNFLTLAHLREQHWERRDLADALSQLPNHLCQRELVICLFIDGLDEFEGDESTLVAEMRQLLASPRIKICASSRPHNLFERAFGGEEYQWKLELHIYTRKDIAELARSQLYGDEGFLLIVQNEKHRAGFIRKIEEQANGVFLWAVLVVREIIREIGHGGDMSDLENTLETLPPALGGNGGLFQRILERSDPRCRTQTARLLLLMRHVKTREPYIISWQGAYFVFRVWSGTHSINRGCLQLDDKYRRPWQGRINTGAFQEPCCCGIFLKCHHSNPDLHPNGCYCNVDTKLLVEDAKRQVRRWCPDFVDTRTDEFMTLIVFSHKSVGDYLAIPEVQNNLAALAGEGFDPCLMLCYSWLASSRLQISATAGQDFDSSRMAIEAVLRLDETHRDFARRSLRTFEQLHTAECTHSADLRQTGLARTPARWALQLCGGDSFDRYELIGGCKINTVQQYHAWFLALVAVHGGSWYVEEEWPKIPASTRQDAGSIILAALIVIRPSRRPLTDQMSVLVKILLSSDVRTDSTYKWCFRGDSASAGGQYDISLWQVLIRMMPIIWVASEHSWITWILDTMEIFLGFGCKAMEYCLPEEHTSLFSAMKYVPVIDENPFRRKNFRAEHGEYPESKREQQWKTYGPRLQSILASHGLLTREERKLVKQGKLVENAVNKTPDPGSEVPTEGSRSTRKRARDWIRKIIS